MFSLITKYQILECWCVGYWHFFHCIVALLESFNSLIDKLGLALGWLVGNL